MKKTLQILFFALFLYEAKAQNTVDTSAVISLLQEANSGNFAEEEVLKLEDALATSRKIKFKNGTKKALYLLIAHHRSKKQVTEELRYNFQLSQLLEKENNRKELFETLINIGKIYHTESIDSKAIEFFEQAQNLLSNGDYNDAQLNLWQRLAEANLGEKNYSKALDFFEKIENVHQKFDNQKGRVEALQNMVRCSDAQNNFQKSLQINSKIKEIIEQKGEKKYLASIYNNIAINFNHLKNYPKALEYFLYAEKILDNSTLDKAVFATNLGIAYSNNQLLVKSILELNKAKNLAAKDNEKANLNHLIATIYLNNNDTYNSLRYNTVASDEAVKSKDFRLLSEIYATAALANQKLFDYEKAFDFYKKHLVLKDSLQLAELLRQQNLLQQQSALERNEKDMKVLMFNQEIQDLTIKQLNIEKERLSLESSKLGLEASQRDAQIALLQREDEIRSARLRNTELESQRQQQALTLTQQQLLAVSKDKEIANLSKKEQQQRIELLEQQREQDRKKQEITQLQRDKEFEQTERENFRKNAYRFGILGAFIMSLLLGGWFLARRVNQRLTAQKLEIEENNRVIQAERAKSEALLLNILPEETAEELKTLGRAASRKYEKVSILFTDFVNFSGIAEKLSPEELIEELNTCFYAFDEIAEKHQLEKIKTIGDAYMCAGGIPTPNETNPFDAVNASLEILDFMKTHNENRSKKGLSPIGIRIGIHTGEVIAGVVGSRKFAYDIWGDAVNIASRMESNSEPNRLNISETTFLLVKNKYKCTFRGKIAAKNKGDLGMYFLD